MRNETLDAIRRRRSARSYLAKPLEAEVLNAVLEAGLTAPYAGEPSVHFSVVQDPALLASLTGAAKKAARRSPVPHLAQLGSDDGFEPLYGAPVLVVLSDQADSICPEVNCAIVAENLLIAAESLGLGACWIYFVLQAFDGPDSAALAKRLGIPDGHRAYASVILGYAEGDKPQPHEPDWNRISYN